MSPIAILILSLSMSADAFAAAIGRGAQQRPDFAQAVRSGLVFGIIEALTPLIGFGLGIIAAGLVEAIDHWIAFGLLGAVGAKMIWEALKRDEDDAEIEAPSKVAGKAGMVALVATAVGTSIDAGAIGVSLALLGENIWIIAAAIGATTFVLATLGLLIGKVAGTRLGRIVELVGGVALIVLGSKILMEHLGYLPH
ncbi:manganese efflux pump MntP family protein [Brevundimonas terrae]|jgi:putative Mn2+ efflux pump MntP|uniref:Putative manganese efflux pump MntP n=1 Tax=Brevundimonas terrae TaxID=363631 RepID=A0ABN0Y0U2_9CAUL|nr:manganese efflux pump MntP family protein [Brevundimonas terrae]NIJ26148.1 putative Mn2+ efflux pump MntP [Brevundimonas terrae]